MKRFFTAIFLSAAVIFTAAAEFTMQPFAPVRGIKEGKWHFPVKMVAQVNGNEYTVPGNPNDQTGIAGEYIQLDQSVPEPVKVSAEMKRDAVSDAGLVCLDMDIHYADGSQQYVVNPRLTGAESGKWIAKEYTFTPRKPIKKFRLICFNLRTDGNAGFRNVKIGLTGKPAAAPAPAAAPVKTAAATDDTITENGITFKCIAYKPVNAIAKNRWSLPLKHVAKINGSEYTIPGDPNDNVGITSAFIPLNQSAPAPILLRAEMKRDAVSDAGLVCLDMDVRYTDGTQQYVVNPRLTGAESGKWITKTFVFSPRKPVKEFRLICFNLRTDGNAGFRNVIIGLTGKDAAAPTPAAAPAAALVKPVAANAAVNGVNFKVEPFKPNNGMKNGRWGLSVDSVASVNGNNIVIPALKDKENAGITTGYIELDQQSAEPIRFGGEIKSDKVTGLVCFWMEVFFQDGTRQWVIASRLAPQDAGKWVDKTAVYTPPKPIQKFRAICLSMNNQAPAEFRNVSIGLTQKKNKLIPASAKNITFESNGFYTKLAYTNSQLFIRGIAGESGHNLIAKDANAANIWRLRLRSSKNGRMLNIDAGGKLTIADENGKKVFSWAEKSQNGVKFKVTVTAEKTDMEQMADWKIAVDLKSDEYSLEEILFPVVPGISVPGDAEKSGLFFPQDVGRLIVNPERNLHGNLNLRYGTWYFAMQYIHYAGEHDGFFMMTPDGKGFIKQFNILRNPGQKSLCFQITHLPERGATSFATDYAVRFGTLNGNWFDAAKLYRSWAEKQMWTNSHGKLATRNNFPKPLSEAALFINWIDNIRPMTKENWAFRNSLTKLTWSTTPGHILKERLGYAHDTEKVIQNFRELRNFYGTPLIDYSHPYIHPFNMGTPAYIVPDGLPEAMKALRADGVYFVPWTSARLFDLNTAKFKEENAARSAIIDHAGNMKTMIDSVKMAPMCMATEYWRNVIIASTVRLLNDGFSGVYYDELASSGAEICYATNHEHNPGGGRYGLNARRKVLTDLHNAARNAGHPEYFSCGEEACEYLIGIHDANFMFASTFPDNVPAYQAVYHDYSYSFSRAPGKWMDPKSGWYRNAYVNQSGNGAIEELVTHSARNLSYGVNIGIVRRDLPQFSPEGAEIIARFAKLYHAGRKFLIFGEMLRPPVVTDQLTQSISWSAGNINRGTAPVIYSSMWQDINGNKALLAVNTSVFPIAPEFDLSATIAPDKKYALKNILSGEIIGVTGSKFRIPIAGRDGIILELMETEDALRAPAIPDFTVVFDHDMTERRANEQCRVRFTLDNHTDSPRQGKVTFTMNGVAPVSRIIAISGKGRKQLSIPVTMPKQGVNAFTVTTDFDGIIQQHTTHIGIKAASVAAKNKKRYTAKKAVNGDFAPGTPVISDLTKHIADHRGAADLSAVARVNWSEAGLLLEFTVTDDVQVSPNTIAEDIWRGDCIQMVLGLFYPEQGRHVYRNIFLTMVNGDPFALHLESPDDSEEVIKLTAKREGNQTVYRALIDKALFPDEFKTGTRIPFSFTVNECDDKTGNRGWLQWTPGICGAKDHDALGEIVLQ
ncbi:MAG: hypothetical protein IKA71_02230 [Lentisphaeria bacterium]|nr:hypothetical protein [Lentisphaeria bacterium]